VFYVKEGSAKI